MLESESLSPRGDRSEGLETDSVLEDDDVRLLKFEVLLVNLLRLIPKQKNRQQHQDAQNQNQNIST